MEKQNNSTSVAGLIMGGCMFIGMGIGWAVGAMKAGLFIGLGAGLLGMAVVMLRSKKS